MANHIYRLIPTAPPDDHNWARALCQGEIVVRARSSGEARAIAARAEAHVAGTPSKTTGQAMASAFRDPALYGVRLDDGGLFPQAGHLGVLSGNFRIPAGWVAHDD